MDALEGPRFATVHVPSARQLTHEIETTEPPDLLLTDVCASSFDGLRFLQWLETHQSWCAVPVIALTHRLTVEQVKAWRRLQVPPEALLLKPVQPEQLLQTVDRVLARKLPGPLVKSLERARLQARLTLAAEQSTLDREIREVVDAGRAIDEALAAARKELHRAIRKSHLLTIGATPPSGQVTEERAQLEARIETLRGEAQANASEHRRAVLKRHEATLRLRRSICEIENRIRSLNDSLRLEAMRRGGASKARAQH